MKRVRFVIRDPDINRVLGNEIDLELDDGASVVDLIRRVDELIVQKVGSFPVEGFKSLLHLTFHPVERRFYSHAALTAYSCEQRFVDVRGNVDLPLPDGAVVILALTICGSEWERIVDADSG